MYDSEEARRLCSPTAVRPRGTPPEAAAAAGGLSELELALAVPSAAVFRLRPDAVVLYQALDTLGRVRSRVRTACCVHEARGDAGWFGRRGSAGALRGRAFQLSVRLDCVASALAAVEDGAAGPLPSLHLFDASGAAVHRIWLEDPDRHPVFYALVQRLHEATPAASAGDRRAGDPERRGGVDRERADDPFAPAAGCPLEPRAAGLALEIAQRLGVGVVVTARTAALSQSFTGVLDAVHGATGGLAARAPGFELRLCEQAIARVRLVRVRSPDGEQQILAAYDSSGRLSLQVGGACAPAGTEGEGWRACTTQLPRSSAPSP